MKLFMNLSSSDRGASMVEYGLIVAVISMMSVSAVTLLGDNTEEAFETVAEAMDAGQTSDGGSVSSTAQEGSGDGADQSSDDSQDEQQDDSSHEQSDDESQADSDSQGANEEQGSDDDSQDETQGETDGSQEDESDEAGTKSDEQDDDQASEAGNGDGGTVDSGDSDEDEPAQEKKGSEANPTKTASSFIWWNDNKHGGQGEWKASVTFENDWTRHQYLTLEVTTVDHKGKTKTTQVDSFYVPANGSTTFHHWGNFMKDHKGKVTGVMEVHVEVVNVKTSDESWKPVSFPQDGGSTSTVEAPPAP